MPGLAIDPRTAVARSGARRAEWFDDYAVGDTVVSPVVTIATEDVRSYSRFTNDVRPVFHSTTTVDSAPVPQLFLFSLGIALLLHGTGIYIPRYFVAFFGFDVIEFHQDVRTGASIQSKAVVSAMTERGRNGLITYEHRTTLAGDGPALVTSTHRILVERRGADG